MDREKRNNTLGLWLGGGLAAAFVFPLCFAVAAGAWRALDRQGAMERQQYKQALKAYFEIEGAVGREDEERRIQGAIEQFEALVQKKPKGEYLMYLGALHAKKGELDAAMDFLNRSVKADRRLHQAWADMAAIRHKQGQAAMREGRFGEAKAQFEEAMTHYDRAISLNRAGFRFVGSQVNHDYQNLKGELERDLETLTLSLRS